MYISLVPASAASTASRSAAMDAARSPTRTRSAAGVQKSLGSAHRRRRGARRIPRFRAGDARVSPGAPPRAVVHGTRGDALEERSAVHPRRDEPRSKGRRDGALDEAELTRAEIPRRRRLNPSVGVVAGHPQRRLDATDQRDDVGTPSAPPGHPAPAPPSLVSAFTSASAASRTAAARAASSSTSAARPGTAGSRAARARRRRRRNPAEEAPAGAVRKPVRCGLGGPSAALEGVATTRRLAHQSNSTSAGRRARRRGTRRRRCRRRRTARRRSWPPRAGCCVCRKDPGSCPGTPAAAGAGAGAGRWWPTDGRKDLPNSDTDRRPTPERFSGLVPDFPGAGGAHGAAVRRCLAGGAGLAPIAHGAVVVILGLPLPKRGAPLPSGRLARTRRRLPPSDPPP